MLVHLEYIPNPIKFPVADGQFPISNPLCFGMHNFSTYFRPPPKNTFARAPRSDFTHASQTSGGRPINDSLSTFHWTSILPNQSLKNANENCATFIHLPCSWDISMLSCMSLTSRCLFTQKPISFHPKTTVFHHHCANSRLLDTITYL